MSGGWGSFQSIRSRGLGGNKAPVSHTFLGGHFFEDGGVNLPDLIPQGGVRAVGSEGPKRGRGRRGHTRGRGLLRPRATRRHVFLPKGLRCEADLCPKRARYLWRVMMRRALLESCREVDDIRSIAAERSWKYSVTAIPLRHFIRG